MSSRTARATQRNPVSRGKKKKKKKKKKRKKKKNANHRAEEMAPVAKSSDCSPRGFAFNSQHPHGGSQPPVIPVPGYPMSFLDLQRHRAHRHKFKQNIHICKINKQTKV
jgi:hypothetical protein